MGDVTAAADEAAVTEDPPIVPELVELAEVAETAQVFDLFGWLCLAHL